MKKVLGLQCILCGKDQTLKESNYVCVSCGGNLTVSYDYNLIKKRLTYKVLDSNPDKSIWRYTDILPVQDIDNVPQVHAGWTPLYRADKLAEAVGVSTLYIKDEGRNPSCSIKDRASMITVARALDLDEKVVTVASKGHLGVSLACLTGSLDMRTIVFVNKLIPAGRINQLMIFGAVAVSVDGSYDDAFDVSLNATQEYGWYNCNEGHNPFTREGLKTCAFEICEQMDWEVPDKVVVPVGDGNVLSAIWKGFVDFHKLGIIEKLPQMVAVQAQGSQAVMQAFMGDGEIKAVSGQTIASSIMVSLPRDGMAAVLALKQSNGFAVSVSDEEILKAVPEIARGANVSAEISSAAAYAGLKKAVSEGKIKDGESVALVITASGFKDADAVKMGKPYHIKPVMDELRKLVSKEKL